MGRFLEGRRRRILEEYHHLIELNNKKANLLVVGAGFIGVEWATELEYVFPDLTITILDMLPKCLGPLPESAAEYCSEYMHASGIREFYGVKYSYDDMELWKKIGLPDKVPKDCIYECVGVKASTYFFAERTSLHISFRWRLDLYERVFASDGEASTATIATREK